MITEELKKTSDWYKGRDSGKDKVINGAREESRVVLYLPGIPPLQLVARSTL
jgi:hypothetical protein